MTYSLCNLLTKSSLILALIALWSCGNKPGTAADQEPIVISPDADPTSAEQIVPSAPDPQEQFPESHFAPALEDLSADNQEDIALLIAFDTDTTANSLGYDRFNQDEGPIGLPEGDFPTNKTLLWTRKNEKVALKANINCVASPQQGSFLFLGLITYREQARMEDNYYRSLKERSQLAWPFEYTGIWQSESWEGVPEAARKKMQELKDTLDFRYTEDSLQFITDYEKISFITADHLFTEGFFSHVHGGATWFNAFEYCRLFRLDGDLALHHLNSWIPVDKMMEITAKTKEKYGDRRHWKGETIDYIKDPVFTLTHLNGRTFVKGLVEVDANSSRSFMAAFNGGVAPRELVGHNYFPLSFSKLKEADSSVIDAFFSPNRSTLFVITDQLMYAIDVNSKRELFKEPHGLVFNKVVMVEWARGENVTQWEQALGSL